VKCAKEVGRADQIPTLVRRAFHDSNAAPTGPFFLSLPMDVMEQMMALDMGEVSVVDRASIAGSLDRLTDYLAAVTPGKLAIIAGDEVSTSNAAAETVRLADALVAPVYGSSWPAHIPFPTSHPPWTGNLPTKANEIAQELKA
jgi:benzoylformate decarboxylase